VTVSDVRRLTGAHDKLELPDKFIPIVEQSGLMPLLGKWALRGTCHQLKAFQNLMPGFVMSVNVSPVQFGGEDFDSLVLDAIADADIDPATLVLEITPNQAYK
jgi:diguanylate cyclase